MAIKFIDKETVRITKSLSFSGGRPEKKVVIFDYEVVKEFTKANSSYEVLSVSGPFKITNCNNEAMSKGEWILKVSKRTNKKVSVPVTQQKTSPPVQTDAKPAKQQPVTKTKTRTKSGA